jgi:hypothetical protein
MVLLQCLHFVLYPLVRIIIITPIGPKIMQPIELKHPIPFFAPIINPIIIEAAQIMPIKYSVPIKFPRDNDYKITTIIAGVYHLFISMAITRNINILCFEIYDYLGF